MANHREPCTSEERAESNAKGYQCISRDLAISEEHREMEEAAAAEEQAAEEQAAEEQAAEEQGFLGMLEGLIEWFANLCNIFINIWNNLVGILNFILGMVLDPLGFLWWCFVGMMTFFINILPQTPEQFTLNYAVQQIAVTTGLGVSLINELFSIASWFLIIMAVIKIYKLLPFKMS